MAENDKVNDDFVHLARLALSGRLQDVQLFLHKAAKKYRAMAPDLAGELRTLLHEMPTHASPLRRQEQTKVMPVDLDSRLQLVVSNILAIWTWIPFSRRGYASNSTSSLASAVMQHALQATG